MSAASKLSRDDILALVPPDAQRIKVTDEKGHERWRDISKGTDTVLASDNIMLVSSKPVTMKGKPGRRKKAAPAKAPPPINQTVANIQAAKGQFFTTDPLLSQIDTGGVDSEDTLLLIMRGFAQEAASLEFERLEAERTGKETSAISVRRINALKALGDTWIKRKEQLAGKTVDMESPAFARLFEFMMATFRESMLKGNVPRDQAETVFARLSERMADETWEQEARNKMKGA
jgi:hypothetical protein